MKSYKKMVNSDKEITRELYDAIKDGGGEGTVVDVVEKGNMNAVTSNAVAWTIDKNGKVIVTVTDFETGAVIGGASVKLDSETKLTNAAGKCSFTGVKYGAHVLKISYTDYNTIIDGIYLDTSSYAYTAELVPIETENYGTINVTVLDKNSREGLGNSTVIIDTNIKQTDSSGKCVFEGLKYGTYLISVNHDNYTDNYKYVSLNSFSQDVTVEMSPVDLKGSLKVNVVDDSTTEPIKSAKVTVNGSTQYTDDSGTCTFSNLKYAQYELKVEYNNYNSYSTFVTINTEETTVNVYLTPVSPTTGTINVIVHDTNDNPLINASVTIDNTTKVTDTSGQCSFENLSYSTYTVTIECKDYEKYTDSIILDNETVDYTVKLTLLTATVVVTVKDDTTSELLSDANVTLNETTLITDTDGKCTFSDVPYGDYDINVTRYDYNDFTDTVSVASEYLEYNVMIHSGIETSNVTISVFDKETETPINGATVNLGEYNATTDSDGKCVFENILYSTYTLTVSYDDYEEYTESLVVESAEMEYEVLLVPIPELITFKGTVQDRQGVLENVNITINDKCTGYTDSDGTYNITCALTKNVNVFSLTFTKTDYEALTINITKVEGQEEYEVDTQTLELSTFSPANVVAIVKNRKYESEEYETSNNVKLTLQHIETSTEYTFTSDDYGQLFMEDINAGRYNLIIQNNVNYKTETQEDVFFVRPSQTLNDVEFILTKIVHEFELTLRYNDKSFITNNKVVIRGEEQTALYTGITDEYGKLVFNIANEPVQILTVDVYISNTETVTVEIGRSSLTSADVTVDYIYDTSEVSIVVTNINTGVAVENVKIYIGDDYGGTTDASGKCTFPKIRYSTYTIKITGDGYNEYTDTLIIQSEELTYNAELIEEGKHKLSLEVLWMSDKTHAYDQKIAVYRKDTEEIFAKGTTGDTGYFNCAVPDDLESAIWARQYSWNEEKTSDQYLGSSELTNATIYIVSLDTKSKLTIHVKERTGDPVVGASIKFDSITYTTGSDGNYTFDAPYGTHNLLVTCNGYFSSESTVEVNSTEQTIEVLLDPEIYYARFHVNDSGSGLAVRGATIILGSAEATTDDNGMATMTIPSKGTYYSFNVTSDDYDTYTGTVIATGPVTEVYVAFQQANAIRFVVKDAETSKAIVGAKVVIEGTSGYTDDIGECLLRRIELGDHSYGIFHDDYYDIIDTIHISDTSTIVHVNMNHKKGDVTIVTVNSITKEPAPNIFVRLSEETEDEALTFSGTTDENGECTFADVKYATYTALFKNAYYVVDQEHITVNSNPFRYEVPIICRYSDATLRFVDDSTEEPIQDVQFIFGDYSGVSNANGEYYLSKIDTTLYATYDLSAYHDEYYSYDEKDVEVASATQLIIIKLGRGYSTVEINLFDSVTGLKISNATVSLGGVIGISAATGICTLQNVPYNSSRIDVVHTDYDEYIGDVNPIHGTTAFRNITLTTSKSRGECSFTVTDVDTGSAIEEGIVYIDNNGYTLSDGKCTVKNVIYSSHELRIASIGYQTYSTTILVRKASTTWTVLLYKSSGNLEVTIVGTDDNLYVSNATVTVASNTTTTDESGKAYFTDIRYGTWTCTATHPYYITYQGEAVINTTSNYKSIGLPSKTGKVIITVLDSSTSEPVPDSNVFLDDNIQTVDSEGKATFEGIYYADSHKLKVTNSYYQTKETTISVTGEKTEMTIKITHW